MTGLHGGARRTIGFVGLCFATTLIVMEASVVNLAVPSIRRDLGASAIQGVWIVDAYILVVASLLLVGGRIGDRIGAKRCLVVGLLFFGFASIPGALAQTALELVAVRTIQGIGAALVIPAPITLIMSMHADVNSRAKAVGLWGSISGLGLLIGPLAGGVLLDSFGWQSIFLINVPIVTLVVCAILCGVEETPTAAVRFDVIGQSLAASSLVAIAVTFTLLHGMSIALGALISVLLAVCFFYYEAKVYRSKGFALLPVLALANRSALTALFAGFVFNFTLYGLIFCYSTHFQDELNYSPVRAGLSFLPLTVSAIVVSTLFTGRFVAARGPRVGIAVGMASSAIGLTLLAASSTFSFGVTGLAFALFGAGMVLSGPSQIMTLMAFIPSEYSNSGSSILHAARQVGGLIGVAILGRVASSGTAGGLKEAMLTSTIACVVCGVLAVAFIPGRRFFRVEKSGASVT